MTNNNTNPTFSKNEELSSNVFEKNEHTMNYQEKLQAKREYYLAKAEQSKIESDNRCNQAIRDLPDNGQPILIGHYSEKKHRRVLERSDFNMRKAVEADKKALEYQRKAESVGTGGISSHDEDALIKLNEKLIKLEAYQNLMKLANKQFKKGGWDAVDCMSDEEKISAGRYNSCEKSRAFPTFELTNNNANIKATKKRIQQLEAARSIKPVSEHYDIFDYKIDDNRIQFIFSGKPNDEIRSILKNNAFLWSPSRGAWVRKLTGNALFSAKSVKMALLKL